MNNLEIYKNEEFGTVRTVEMNGIPYFVAKDVADALGYDQTSNMLKRIDDEDFISSKLDGMNMKSTLINESGLYSAILGSQLPTAKKFKRWVTSEVLPSIHKNGMYAKDELLDNPDLLLEVITKLRTEREEKLKLKEENEVLEIALNISLDYYTVAKYNKEFKKGWSLKQCQNIGKTLTAYCKANGIIVKSCKTNDERFGDVNSYPLKVWNSFLKIG